jgi:hypothetical protein
MMLEESMIFEDAHQHHKEFHGSNNDCTAAYDKITPWTSETIYQYHGLSQRLIAFMLNIDKHQYGKILTADGAGEDFEKVCGLGQGSILAPPKWKLFLDPLLKELDHTGAPYIMGTGDNKVEIYAAAFADDLTVIAPTHKDYKLRMELTNKYLSFSVSNLTQVKPLTHMQTQTATMSPYKYGTNIQARQYPPRWRHQQQPLDT